MTDILPIKAFDDNYIWSFSHNGCCAVVDPGDEKPVLQYLQQNQLRLTDILLTHHHWDHIDGLPALLEQFPDVNIYGVHSSRVPLVNRQVCAGERFQLSGLPIEFEVIDLPGHTRDHIGYVNSQWLFCGDTLFSAGCGRLFEGTPEQMLHSLQKLAALDDSTQVYCTHEYTLANLAFAREADPHNDDTANYEKWARQQKEMGLPTLPTTIAQQKAINPFLRCHTSAITHTLQQKFDSRLRSELETFTCLRSWKDKF